MLDDRSQSWLEATLRRVWAAHFDDVPMVNLVRISYCRPSRTRLGWIALSESGASTLIGINRLLRHADAPEAVSVVTIAHELVHYGHGFGSPLPQRLADPHAGGVVERELESRGLGDALRAYDAWTDRDWFAFYERHKPQARGIAMFDRQPARRAVARHGDHAALDLPATRACRAPGSTAP